MGKSAIPRVTFRTVGGALLLTMVAMAISGTVAAQGSCAADGCIDVVAVDGLVDDIQASNITDAIASAEASGGVEAVVLQMDSEGVATSTERLEEVAGAIRDAAVPVTVWIGPSGAVALGGAAELVAVADVSGIAPGAEIGDVGPQRLPAEEFGELYTGAAVEAADEVFEGEAAVEAGLVDRFAPIVREHIVNIDGVSSETREVDGERAQTPTALVRFSKLPLGTQFLHTVASPSVAYLLLVAGLGLLLFEFYTAGVGIAGVVGAGCFVLAAYGVAALPHNTWALGLLVGSSLGFAVDVQSGIPRVWTALSMVAFAVGSLFLFTEFRPTWLALAAGLVGMAATVFSGMPAMVRARFGTPSIDRDWMVGMDGEVVTPLDPEGTIRLRGALWRARTDGAAMSSSGTVAHVVGVDGLVAEVEPNPGVSGGGRGGGAGDPGGQPN